MVCLGLFGMDRRWADWSAHGTGALREQLESRWLYAFETLPRPLRNARLLVRPTPMHPKQDSCVWRCRTSIARGNKTYPDYVFH